MAGTVFLVGLGPGGTAYLTPEARAVLQMVGVVVGHSNCLRRLRRIIKGKETLTPDHNPLERARLAAARALAGLDVAIVSIGHPGIYAIASTFYGYLQDNNLDIPVTVIPGLTLGDYAAAKLGSPLGANHAVISLADRGCSWRDVKAALAAALAADFVVVIYNPRGKMGADRLKRAMDLILLARSAETPVGLVTDATSRREKVIVLPLGALDAKDVKVDTLLVIGSCTSFIYRGNMITPRSYHPGSGY